MDQSPRIMSTVYTLLLAVFLTAAPGLPSTLTPCDVTNLVLNMTVPMNGVDRPLDCPMRDVKRIVCVASLHNFNIDNSIPMGQDTAKGIFGIPDWYVKTCPGFDFQAQLLCYTSLQFVLRKINCTTIAESLCDNFISPYELTSGVQTEWNTTVEPNSSIAWNKKLVTCKTSNSLNNDSEVYVAGSALRRNYIPGIIETEKIEIPRNDTKPKCKELTYCMNLCSPPKNITENDSKTKNVDSSKKWFLYFNWILPILCLIVILATLLAVRFPGKWNVRKRQIQSDDWSRPILYEQPTW